MIVEWECILDCNFTCEYCVNSRNSALDKPIKFEKNKDKIFEFLNQLKAKFPNEELFIFGGEPFLHPFISEIIKYLNDINMKFIIQTNGSKIDIIKNIDHRFMVQVSIHPSQINNKEKFIQNLVDISHLIRRIDVMYIGDISLEYVKELIPFFKNKIVVKPVADFKFTNVANQHLYKFNQIKQSLKGKVYNFEEGNRSFLWEDQMKGNLTYKGKPCAYKDIYVLYDPMLNKYNCSYRQNNEICPNEHCFLM